MFNPKSNNLLDDQLAFSGLEMNWVPAAIAAGTAIIGGIMGSQEADKQNRSARKAQEEQEKFQKEIAKRTNNYNKKIFQADKANYYAMREYSHNTNLRNWQYGKDIQDFEYLQSLRQFQKSTVIGNEQLGLNREAMGYAIQAENAAIEEAFIQQQFQHRQSMDALKQTYVEQNINRQEQFVKLEGIRSRKRFGNLSFQNTVEQLMTQGALAKESEMVKGLVAAGATQAAGQAGKSTAKTQQSNMAALHRGLMVLESELSGKYKQAAVQLAELNADSSLQEMGVGLNLDRIDAAINNAQNDTQFNLDVMRENMRSTIAQSQRDIRQIGLERRVADVNTRAGMMLFPERMPYAPEPELPPERIFVKPLKAKPGFVPPAQQQSTWAPLIQGGLKAAGALASVDWGGGNSITPPGDTNITPNIQPTTKLTDPIKYLNNSPSNFTGGTAFPFP